MHPRHIPTEQETSVQEGSPPDATPPSDTPDVTTAPPSDADVDAVVDPAPTVEGIEAIWKNRVAGKDRAHAAETAELRRQIEERDRRLAEKQERESADMTDAEREKARADAAEQRLAEIERNAVRDVRQVKFAAAAEVLDEGTLVGMDEAKLAALNARLSGDEGTPPPPIDPNAPRRPSNAPPAAPRDKSVEELEADLRKHEPSFVASLQD
jgi:hypothetical protein